MIVAFEEFEYRMNDIRICTSSQSSYLLFRRVLFFALCIFFDLIRASVSAFLL